jgi:hypothetical protein
MLDLALLQPEIANGLCKKSIEMLTKEIHCEPLPAGIRATVIASWKQADCCQRGPLSARTNDPSACSMILNISLHNISFA